MKSLFKVLAVLFVTAILASSCVTKTDSELITGKWQSNGSSDVKIIVEFTKDMQWMFYKNDDLLEKGVFELKEGHILLKHAQEEHAHDNCNHEHKHSEDHEMDYVLESEMILKMGHGDKMSTYKRL
ncbi:hypothetical protein DWB61_02545 [Ancylomarina euxinus]|uniref:Lipocalin-like domain-containing protein n=1 Tax=Ancylomarina euxinus TaxID=2283627 RepID=A0A425Y676_9BACT|nr:hypothetical protein [Ancylomarina euxinus]MCZ4694118.1 hypothetical protein [Ancylomarina euxinus]MUP15783.1 hypothetical protein [Ancylomarina euxinus]RRG24013.1 hypothetical protein DWB61_02545 [Ancylomarina euxinus]